MRRLQRREALGRGHQEDAADAARAGALEHVDGGDQGAAGGQHGVEDERVALGKAAGEAFVVGDRLERGLVALQPHHADACRGDQRQHARQHAQAGAQDRHQGDLGPGDAIHLDRPGPALAGGRFHGQIAGGLVGQQRAQLGDQLAEILGVERGIAQQADLVAHERMTDFDDIHGRTRLRDVRIIGPAGADAVEAEDNRPLPCGVIPCPSS